MSNQAIKVEGLDHLTEILLELKDPRTVKAAIKAGALHLKGWIAKYPPSSEANVQGPHPSHWYERGYGSRWTLAGGGVGGSKTSEFLGRKWAHRSIKSGWAAEIGNVASYARDVQAHDQQKPYHRDRGWRTDKEAVDTQGNFIVQLISKAIAKILGRKG